MRLAPDTPVRVGEVRDFNGNQVFDFNGKLHTSSACRASDTPTVRRVLRDFNGNRTSDFH
ncbi:hypothetical protein LZ318_14635 [Saccharopolyspora indica]|uniref:hypothetical protein n=1 Tax=Saccharopolyspora indica TaxID=1229659 RepID=UPI0022EB86EB|nr:hypothetical protein [Saccharopolyspora indica]MDA3649229.1 hypothetical protein [Saccharopolyspora indica]